MATAAKPAVLRAVARLDIDAAFEHYMSEAGAETAGRFMDALEVAYSHIATNPGTGSPRHAVKLNLGGLRFWSLGRYPYLVFYFEMPDSIDVVRVLHGAMDLPQYLQGSGGAHKAEEPLPEWV